MGTALGAIAGNLLPLRIVSAFSVALYGMFIAVFIPPARKNKVIAGLVVVSFTPVSYTHLDVYKRQALISSIQKSLSDTPSMLFWVMPLKPRRPASYSLSVL